MKITDNLINALQNRLKVGNLHGFHLITIPGSSRYKFDLSKLSAINEDLPNEFIQVLLAEQPLRFKISWIDNIPNLNSLFEEVEINHISN